METLDILEEKIKKMLKAVDSLRKENQALTVRLEEKEEEVRGLNQDIDKLLAEREEIKTKVTRIITCVEEF